MAAFEGFADASCKFWKQLAKHQDKAWYEAHKDEHKAGWEAPMRALLAELRDKLDAAYPDCDLAEPKVFRIHRDVRFSKDKTPYKTNVSGYLHISAGGAKGTEAPSPLYLQVGLETMAAAGMYMMSPLQLAKYRAAVLDEKKGAELGTIVAKLTRAGFTIDAASALKKPPKGVDPDHPRAELTKLKGLVVMFPKLDSRLLASRELVKVLTDHGKKVAPLVRWLVFATA
jgi:uncharacterized protein (TIGR02453 family)